MTPSLLQQIAGGDPGAVPDCIDRYGALIWGLARRLSSSPSDAEEATQEIFLWIWRHAARFDPSLGSEKTFIAMIARRRLIDRLRKGTAAPAMDSSAEMRGSVADPSRAVETCLKVEQGLQPLAE
jgi:RNA polymerase sigma factor (sigma-70 family)